MTAPPVPAQGVWYRDEEGGLGWMTAVVGEYRLWAGEDLGGAPCVAQVIRTGGGDVVVHSERDLPSMGAAMRNAVTAAQLIVRGKLAELQTIAVALDRLEETTPT